MTIILKLGGSVITKKDRKETLDEVALDRAAATIANGGVDRLVLVHGGGSFGHPSAATHGVTRSAPTTDAGVIREIHGAMVRLNAIVVERLATHGVPAIPIHPLSVASRARSGSLTMDATAIETHLDEGFVPVTHGDIVAHAGAGATILSGDEIVTALAGAVAADRVGLCSTVPGVLADDGTVVEHVGSYDEVMDVIGTSEATDVTGGMAGKIRALLDLQVPGAVFALDDLARFLAGELPGTRVGTSRSSESS